MATQINSQLAERIQQATGENVFLCYHCVKCTSGCPLLDYFDLAPNQIMRAAQLGQQELIFASKTPWLCASCQTCTTRCPQGIDLARVMDFIVSEALQQGIAPKVPEVALFNKVFLRDVDILGRSYELGLIAELNLRTGQPLKDVPLGLEMVKRGGINLLPEIVRRKRRPAPASPPVPAENQVGYFPGCSLHSTAKPFDRSARGVLAQLGVEPVEPKGWVCCGSTPAHRVDHRRAVCMPLESMLLFQQQGLQEITLPCAACYNRFRTAAHELSQDPELREDLTAELGQPLPAELTIRSLLDLVVERIGLQRVAGATKKPLHGLRVASYYGCLLTRPPAVTQAADSEYPMAMDRLMEALGATPVDWDHKVSCCGASLSLTNTEIVLDLSAKILANARARGADLVAVACPLCHSNLDMRQRQMPQGPYLPALYFTQLMALAFDQPELAMLQHNMIDPRPLLAQKGLL